MERAQPIVIGINEQTGELIWTNIEMPLWQRKMFPIRYTGDFSAFWQKLSLLQSTSVEYDGPNFAGFHSYIPNGVKKKAERRPARHNGD